MLKTTKALLILSVLCVNFALIGPSAFCQDEVPDPLNQLAQLLSNPVTILVFLVQFGLGLGLGYFSVKAMKYIVAIASIIALGLLLNIWQFGGIEAFLEAIGITTNPTQIIQMLNTIIMFLGILTLLPIGIGFFVGAIAAVVR